MYGDARLIGMGLQESLPGGLGPNDRVTHLDERPDGTVVISAVVQIPGAEASAQKVMALDFSGISGAPGLFAFATWEEGAEPPAAPTGHKAEGQDAIRAILKQTFGKPPETGAPTPAPTHGAAAKGAHQVTRRVTLGGRSVSVTTVQKGEPPDVNVVGDGADQRIRVGGRTIRLDGDKFVLGRE